MRIYMRPRLPKGCFVDISTVGLPPSETRIHEALAALDRETEALFRKRFMQAIEAGQLPRDSNVLTCVCAFISFLKGVALLARGDLSQAELAEIARRGLRLLPSAQER